MKRTHLAALLAALMLAPSLGAQGYRDRGRPMDRDFEDRRGRVGDIIADCERRTDDFKVALRRALDHSRLDGTHREDELNRSAALLEKAMNRLRGSWNADRDFERSRRHLSVALLSSLRRPGVAGRQPTAFDDAESLRRYAQTFEKTDRGFAADLYAAADRHEHLHGG